ncbi:ligase-associated DNA damage response exonuclease [Profundibacterium mesophilum]|uniref:Cleavage and polyadenylation specificity factor subunit 3 n=1 Tax=Profundibacterium mesophilum KAUST100406-0324 TaxID=1037889 RepID=A0A921TBW6_9RHOB|nr:ligase-associated DNA damage response exonuclease [Profundibacterium mesophilum]KAF0674953.1 cleavage and polyadenylation specificity factor subunit 3 [Profundibacterium mesophilum KAUST100406-0324]
MSALLTFTDDGIYCPEGDFYIDPWRPVDRALITHGHADHARDGMRRYLATDLAAPVMRHRLGEISLETLRYGERREIGGVTVSFHPAGHVPGSAQIRVERGGEVWVASGDYKLEDDGLSTPFEPVPCHAFITESTFGLPVFKWRPQAEIAEAMNAWWRGNAAEGRASIIGVYALGKAQRLMRMLDPSIGPILTHGAIENTNAVLRAQGIALPPTLRVTPDLVARDHPGAMVLATPSALGTHWPRRFGPAQTALASGWMGLRGVRRRRAADRGFIISDHADWAALNTAIAATGAERVFVTHGYTSIFSRWLSEQGYDAAIVQTAYEGESLDDPDPATGEEAEKAQGTQSPAAAP